MPKALTAQQKAYALITLYENQYKAKYGSKPSLNRHRDKWGFQDMLEDLGYDDARDVIMYYFEMKHIGHPLQTLLRNYDRYHQIKEERKEDRARRLELREKTLKRVEEFEKEHGND